VSLAGTRLRRSTPLGIRRPELQPAGARQSGHHFCGRRSTAAGEPGRGISVAGHGPGHLRWHGGMYFPNLAPTQTPIS